MSQGSGITFDDTIRVRDACLCLHTQRAARVLARRFDDALKPVGLTNGQFSLLMALNRPKPARMCDVAALLAMDRTTLTAALKTLERRGLARVEVDPTDRRGRLMHLTDAGREALCVALPIWEKTHAALDARLSDADALRRQLASLSRGLFHEGDEFLERRALRP